MSEPMRGLFLLSSSRFSSMKIGIVFCIRPFLTVCVMTLPLAAADDDPPSPASSSISAASDDDPLEVEIRISLQPRIRNVSCLSIDKC